MISRNLHHKVDISNFLNDNIPNNTSILLTSRERFKSLREKEPIEFRGAYLKIK